MPRRLAAVAVLACLLLAGCSGDPNATARDGLDDARSRAQGWSDDAKLASIAGFEGPMEWRWMGGVAANLGVNGSQRWNLSDWSVTEEDLTSGDGRVPVWGYRFTAPNRTDDYVVVYGPDRGVLHEGTVDDSLDLQPLGAWELDSPDALAKGRANETVEMPPEDVDVSWTYLLARDESTGRTLWGVTSGKIQQGQPRGVFAIVDAATGEVVETSSSGAG